MLMSAGKFPTGVTTVTVLTGVASGVVLVPTAVFVTLPLAELLTVALTISVSVWPSARLAVVITLVLVPMIVTAPLLLVAVPIVSPALRMSVKVTFCAVLGPRLTSVTV
ncbi:MAG: hypothetical protein V4633_21335 [Pseudomonadota bacterium]